MRTPNSAGALWCMLLAALLSSSGTYAAADTKKTIPAKSVSAVADTTAGARHQGAVNVGGISWACKGSHCSATALSSAVAAPLTVCQELAREVGALRSFKVANRALNGKELQQCNRVAPAAEAAKPNVKKPPVATTPKTTSDPASSASPHLKRLITAEDFTLRAQPLPDAPHRVVPSPTPAKTDPPSSPGPRSYPVSIRTDAMTVAGTGRLMDRLAYTSKNIRTEAMSVTGTGRLTANLPFTPKSLRTEGMTVTGTGSIR